MNIIVDTSVIIAVITNEEHKQKLIEMTEGKDLISPASLHWEIGNAFSAMFKRQQITLEQTISAIKAYKQIPIRFHEIELETAVELSHQLNIYAYDAYFIGCALKFKVSLITLDSGLIYAARRAGVTVEEVAT